MKQLITANASLENLAANVCFHFKTFIDNIKTVIPTCGWQLYAGSSECGWYNTGSSDN